MGAKHLRRMCTKAWDTFHQAIHGTGVYTYSSSYYGGGSTGTVPFLAVLVHYVPPNRSALRSFIFLFPLRVGRKEDRVYRLRRSLPEKPGQSKQSPFTLSETVGWRFRREKGLLHVSYCPTINTSILNANSYER